MDERTHSWAGGETMERREGSLTRRDFFRDSALAAVSSAAALAGVAAALPKPEETKPSEDPKLRVLGRTKMKVLPVSFGGLYSDRMPVVMEAFKQGSLFVHTCPTYLRGRSIRAFGEVYRKDKSLRKIFLQ